MGGMKRNVWKLPLSWKWRVVGALVAAAIPIPIVFELGELATPTVICVFCANFLTAAAGLLLLK
jgi:hypothetical protein